MDRSQSFKLYFAIHHCLSGQMEAGKTAWTLTDMAAAIEVHYGWPDVKPNTLDKLLKHSLPDEVGMPIDYRREGKSNVFFYTDPNYNLLEHIDIRPEEQEGLSLLLQLEKSLYGRMLAVELGEQFFRRLQERFARDLPELPRGCVRFERPFFKEEEPAFFETVLRALQQRRAIRVRYQRFGAGPRQFVFHPVVLHQYKTRWYALGARHSDGTMSLLALDRVSEMDLLEAKSTPYQYLPVEHIDRYLQGRIGVSGLDQAPQAIRFRCTPWQLNYLRTRPLHPSQTVLPAEKGAWPVVQLQVAINYELLSELLALGDAIQPLAPEALLHQYRSRLAAMQRLSG